MATQQKGKNFFRNAADWYIEQPTLVKIGIPLGIGIIGRALIRKAKGAKTSFTQQQAYTQGLTVEAQDIPPTYSDAEYMNFAQALYEAMNYGGTSENEIKAVFSKMQSKTDVLKLIKAFGSRALGFYGWYEYYTLPQALYAEMDADDVDTYVNEPLKKNGVNFKF